MRFWEGYTFPCPCAKEVDDLVNIQRPQIAGVGGGGGLPPPEKLSCISSSLDKNTVNTSGTNNLV